MEEKVLLCEGEVLGQVAQRRYGCPIPGNLQSRVEWDFEQPGLVESVPGHDREVGLDDL